MDVQGDPIKVTALRAFTRTWLRDVRLFVIANPVCLSSVTFVHRTQRVETFGNISSPFCTLYILWPPCKILRRSSQGNRSVRGVKRKRGIIYVCHVRVCHSHLVTSLLSLLSKPRTASYRSCKRDGLCIDRERKNKFQKTTPCIGSY